MFGLFKKKKRVLTGPEEARLMEIEYLNMRNPTPATPAAPNVEISSSMETYFEVKKDILRYNIARSGGEVPNEGNDF